MAKFDLKFIDADEDTLSITAKMNDYNQVEIKITDKELGANGIMYICLDKSTAIKFSKTIRTEINKITAREEGNNG